MDQILFYVAACVMFALGLLGFLLPQKVLSLRRKYHLSESVLSGGFLYCTEQRIRWTSLVLALVGLAMLIVGSNGPHP
jgi:hypothetical protein